jgi:AraC-like DNA-binding protein
MYGQSRAQVLYEIAQRFAWFFVSSEMETVTSEHLRVGFAHDVGGIELVHARLQRLSFDNHFHDGYSIGVILRGGLAFDHGGSKHTAPAGVISVLNPGDVHNAYAAGKDGWAFVCFMVPAPVICEIASDALGRQRTPEFRQRAIIDASLGRRLVDLYRILDSSEDLLERQSACLSTFAACIHRHSNATKTACGLERAAVRRAREFLHDCCLRPVSLIELAAAAGLSRFHLLRVFRSEVGLTPHVYLNHLRVLEAKRLVSRGHPISDVALACGFADQSHLTRRFKQILGFTPGAIRIRAVASLASTRPRNAYIRSLSDRDQEFVEEPKDES